ncbi:hypothetical protein L596_018749 [Steinernema carpocapsae]|uniref:Uncharacterized protein n=1 Tax=Steinernema carpocapsae TaxID=34508 RepID=A0A4U5N5J9_STECR|nr:hypothetical protein L596_018749 [Steinernema carpocapsae]
MSVDLKQDLDFQDYMAPFIVFITFLAPFSLKAETINDPLRVQGADHWLILCKHHISFTCLNYCFVTKKDDLTVFEEWDITTRSPSRWDLTRRANSRSSCPRSAASPAPPAKPTELNPSSS